MAITVVLVGILTTLALPHYKNLILNQNVKTAASDLQISFLFARSEAIKRGADILIVPAANDWKNGWSVQLADATVIRARPALNPQLSAIAGTTVTYERDGHVAVAPGSLAFRVLGNTAVTARCVVLDLSGRPSLLYDTIRIRRTDATEMTTNRSAMRDPPAHASVPQARCAEAGFFMIEVLITVVIVLVGLLGLVAVQAKSQVAEMESYQRSQAIVLAQDMASRMNANRTDARNLSYVTAALAAVVY